VFAGFLYIRNPGTKLGQTAKRANPHFPETEKAAFEAALPGKRAGRIGVLFLAP
jgi:hypothetical protein